MKAADKRFEKLPDTPQVLPSECLQCNSEAAYVSRVASDTVEFRNEEFTIEYEHMQCPACGHALLSDDQADARLKKTVEAYQRANHMLTANEVAKRRRALGLSQRELADRAPEIAEATLKRIEGGLSAQNKSTDALVRLCLERLERQAVYEWALYVDRNVPASVEQKLCTINSTWYQPDTESRKSIAIFDGFSFYARPYRTGSPEPCSTGSRQDRGNARQPLGSEDQFATAV